MAEPLLDVRDLTVRLTRGRREARLVDGLSSTVAAGEVLCIVGESGCGKTVTAQAVMGLTRSDPQFSLGGQIRFTDTGLIGLDEAAMRGLRGKRMGGRPRVNQGYGRALDHVFGQVIGGLAHLNLELAKLLQR
jgi:ABC-type glutathione transport system ATPase component